MGIWSTVGVSLLSSASLFAFAVFLAKNYLIGRMTLAFQKEHSKFLDELHWNRKVQVQAAGVAEYLALARGLKEDSRSTDADYERTNQLSWELAMWLPDDVYIQMTRAIAQPTETVNALSVVIEVRRILLGNKAGALTADHVAHHGRGIGRQLGSETQA